MKKKLFHTKKEFKGKVTLEELKRAHIIIVVLSLTLAGFIFASSMVALQFEPVLSLTAAILLLIVAAISAMIAVYLQRK